MLKKRLTKAQFDALDSAFKIFYVVSSSNADEYQLNVTAISAISETPSAEDDPAELRRARDREKEESKTQRARADRLQTEVDKLVANPNRHADLTTLENSWKAKTEDQKTDFEKRITNLKEQLQKVLVIDKARSIALELAGDKAEILLPHIQSRLQAEIADGAEPQTRVLKDGKISALTVDELKKEFVDNKAFSSIIVKSSARGGAGAKGDFLPNATAVPSGKKFGELTETERTDWNKNDPEGFAQAVKEHAAELRKNIRKF